MEDTQHQARVRVAAIYHRYQVVVLVEVIHQVLHTCPLDQIQPKEILTSRAQQQVHQATHDPQVPIFQTHQPTLPFLSLLIVQVVVTIISQSGCANVLC